MSLTDPNDYSGFLNATGNQVGGGLAARQGLAQAMPAISAHQGQQNALQKLAMLRIAQGTDRQKVMQDLQAQMQQMGFDSTQATPMDYAGAAVAGLSSANSILNKQNKTQKNIFQQIFG
jgi:hypothetical protein